MAAFGGSMAKDALRACGLFGHAEEPVLDALTAALRIRRFRKGETIFHQGDPGDALFIVATGSVKVVLPSDEGAEPAIVAVLGAGEFFGELAILDGAPHSATIVALEPTETLVLHRDLHFLDLPGRLASRILRLAAADGTAPTGSTSIPWLYTQSELAGMIGGSRQSVNRLLADLVDEGIIRIERDVLTVTDLGRLARTVER
jgi:CRP-like cAMP-binding protein